MSQDLTAIIAAAVAEAVAAQGTTDDSEDAKPAEKGGKSAAKRSAAVKVPQHTTTDDDGTRWEVTMQHESRPGKDDSVVYREPRISIRAKAKGADDFRKVGNTLPVSVLGLLRDLPDAKADAMVEYAADNRR